MRSAIALVLLAGLCSGQVFQRAKAPDSALDPARILIGRWTEGAGMVDFRYDVASQIIVGRATPNRQVSAWQEMFVIYADGPDNRLHADCFQPGLAVVHYVLETSDENTVQFGSAATGQHVTYRRRGSNLLEYRFETSRPGQPNVTTASGVLTRTTTLIRPLSE